MAQPVVRKFFLGINKKQSPEFNYERLRKMKWNNKRTVLALLAIFVIVFIILINNSFRFWLGAARFSSSNTNSYYYFCIEKVYKIASRKYITEDLNGILETKTKSNGHIYDLTRILGVIGNRYSIAPLMNIYIKHQNDSTKYHELFNVISSLGLIDGIEPHTKILESILEKTNGTFLAAAAACALFHHTGNRYEAVTQNGDTIKSYPGDINLAVRQVILQSKGRKRTFKEMIVLDSSFRPSEDFRGIEDYLR